MFFRFSGSDALPFSPPQLLSPELEESVEQRGKCRSHGQCQNSNNEQKGDSSGSARRRSPTAKKQRHFQDMLTDYLSEGPVQG